MERNELDQQRAARRQQIRNESSHMTVTLPYTDGDVAHVLGQLEEMLLALDEWDDDPPLPASLANREVVDAVGRLASFVASVEREPPAVQPVAPDGRFELVPLVFVTLGRKDQARIVAAVDHLAEPGHPAVAELIGDRSTSVELTQRFQRLRRLAALIKLPWDDDVDVLQARLHRGASSVGRPTERVVLTADEQAAYEQVTDRIVATWSGGDPLERYLYRGA